MVELRRVKRGQPRRCPFCQSNYWRFIEAVPITLEELEKYLLVKYQCEKCKKEFLSEDWRGAKYGKVRDGKVRCAACNSKRVKKVSKPNADIELWECLQCGAYTGIGKG